MPRKYAKKSTKTVVKTAVKTVKRQKETVPESVKTYIKRAIGKVAENKIAATSSEPDVDLLSYNTTTFALPFIGLQDAMNLNQGTGQGERVGNAVKPKVFRIIGHLIPTGLDDAAIPLFVRHIILRQRESFEVPAGYADLFQNGNTTAPPALNMTDIYRPLNKDTYKIYYDKVYTVSPINKLVTDPARSYGSGLSPVKIFDIDLINMAPNVVKYNDANVDPTNVGLYSIFLCANPTNESLTDNTVYGSYSYTIMFEYEDV